MDVAGSPNFVSLNFSLAGEQLPPADPKAIAADRPDMACGLVAFDAWVVNEDRHAGNISYDKNSHQVQAFDHSHALFRGTDGRQYLDSKRDQIALQSHCLPAEITTIDGLYEWIRRINEIPEFYIRGVIQSCVRLGLRQEWADFGVEFLLQRRRRLVSLFKQFSSAFPKVPPAAWASLGEKEAAS